MNVKHGLSSAVIARAQREAQKLVDELAGVRAAVVATADGFEVAYAVTGDANPARVAAMTSSIVAIGGVVAEEADLGRRESLILLTDSGFAVFQSVHRRDSELVIGVLAQNCGVPALVSYRAAQFAKALVEA